MKRKPVSYARFYALLARLAGDRDIAKETLVERFTEGRTSSLREMHAEEYDAMCRTLEAEIEHPGLTFMEYELELRRLRSIRGCGRSDSPLPNPRAGRNPRPQ